MPSHIYIRLGRYSDAVDINEMAAEAGVEIHYLARSAGVVADAAARRIEAVVVSGVDGARFALRIAPPPRSLPRSCRAPRRAARRVCAIMAVSGSTR